MIQKLRQIKQILLSPAKGERGSFSCSACKSENIAIKPLPMHYLREMHNHGFVHNIFYTETINFENFYCSVCYATDRDRLYALYLDDYFKQQKDIALLDIAPAASLRHFIQGYRNVSYRSTDLYMDGVDDKLDITNMHLYKDEQFDFFICSHVLEHIPDDISAMKELYRVLKKGGKGIAMVPINLQIKKTLENPECTDVGERWKLYGQDDHIRAYAKQDFINRLESVGFSVDLMGVDRFGEQKFKQFGIFPNSVLYIVSK